MRLLPLLAAITLLGASAQAAPPQPKRVQVFVVVPTAYSSTVTPEQAMSTVPAWLDEINAWFQREIGRTFDYDLVRLDGFSYIDNVDACGSFSDPQAGRITHNFIRTRGYALRGERTVTLLLGGGGWAGHMFTPKGGAENWGMAGDWGVMQEYGVPNACVPSWEHPNRGFSHELAGALGMYWTDGYSGALFVGDTMSAGNKADLLRYSGRWLS